MISLRLTAMVQSLEEKNCRFETITLARLLHVSEAKARLFLISEFNMRGWTLSQNEILDLIDLWVRFRWKGKVYVSGHNEDQGQRR